MFYTALIVFFLCVILETLPIFNINEIKLIIFTKRFALLTLLLLLLWQLN